MRGESSPGHALCWRSGLPAHLLKPWRAALDFAPVRPSGSHRGGAGEPMVLLHGFTDTWRAWTPVLAALEAHHDVFAPTLPGHHGGQLVDHGMGFAIATLVDLIETQMDGLGFDRAHLVGSSLGGWLCLELAVRGRALSVVGVCPAGGWEPGSRQERAVVRYFRRNALLLHAG